jgi:hypothetical protein
MTTLREAAQAALDAWDTFSSKQQLLVADAMTDLRAALAAPEPTQEPNNAFAIAILTDDYRIDRLVIRIDTILGIGPARGE